HGDKTSNHHQRRQQQGYSHGLAEPQARGTHLHCSTHGGRTNHGTHLAGGVVHTGGGTHVFQVHGAHRGHRIRRPHKGIAHTKQRGGTHEPEQAGIEVHNAGNPHQRRDDRSKANHRQKSRFDAVSQRPHQRRAQAGGNGHRHHHQSSFRRGQPTAGLEPHHDRQHLRCHGKAHGRNRNRTE